MSRPRNVSVSVFEVNGVLRVNASFEIPGSIGREEFPPGNIRVSENDRKRIQKILSKHLEGVPVPSTDAGAPSTKETDSEEKK